MPSFDIVSEVEMREVRNAVENATRELSTRFDFRNVNASITLDESAPSITITTESDFQVKQLLDILNEKLLKRQLDAGILDVPEQVEHSGKNYRMVAKLRQGITPEMAKKMVKHLKDSKLKVQTQIQGDEIRVNGKSRDDLQQAITRVKEGKFGQPFQFKNFRD